MGNDLEQEVFKKPIEYNLTDILLLGKHLRHIPKLMKYESWFYKGYELFLMGGIGVAQVGLYGSLIKKLLDNVS